MNLRILELARQSKNWAYADHVGFTAQMLFEEKFAELIIKETMQVVANTVAWNDYLYVAESVIEHFKE